jgi:WD40 repeat protein
VPVSDPDDTPLPGIPTPTPTPTPAPVLTPRSRPPPGRPPSTYAEALNVMPASVEDTMLATTPRSGVRARNETTDMRSSASNLAPISGREQTLMGSGQPAAAPQPRLTRETPPKIGRYMVIERLGEGGMGVIFAAYDPQLDRKVAIKLVRPAYTESSGNEAQARLVREAQALARLRHPNIVTVYEVGTFGDEVYVAMEFVDGVTLRAWQFEQARTWRDVLRIYQAAGRGLAAAHGAGLVHRDFKPDNVLVTRDGEARVLDFGLAFREHTPGAGPSASTTLSNGDLTMTGALVGTPAYMSPEQHRGQQVDVRTDVFAFSVSFFEALYGTRPYPGNTLPEIVAALNDGLLAPPPSFIKVPAWLRRVIYRGFKIDPKERYQSMDELLRDLTRDPVRYLLIASVVAVVVGVIVALILALRTAQGRQDLRDQGARARADFDHARAELLEAELLRDHGRAAAEQFNAWVVEAARARLDVAPGDSLAALGHLRLDGGSWSAARGVAAEAVDRGIPEVAWSTPEPIAAIAFAERDRWVVTGDARGRIEVRPRLGGASVAGVDHRPGMSALSVVAVARDPEDADNPRPPLRVLALADGELLLWDVANDIASLLKDEGVSIAAAALAPGGERVAIGAADGRLRLYSWNGEPQSAFAGHATPMTAVAWAADGQKLVSGGEDGTVILWNLVANSHREIGRLGAAVRELGFDVESTRLYGVGTDHRGLAWVVDDNRLSTVEVPDVRSLHASGRVRLQLSARGDVALRYDDGSLRALAVASQARALDLDPAGRWAAVGHTRGVEIWDTRARRGRGLAEASVRLGRIVWSPDGRWIAGITDNDGLQLWHAENGSRKILRVAGPTIDALFFTAGDTLIAADGRPQLVAWDLQQDPPTSRNLPAIGGGTGRVGARPLRDGGLLQWHVEFASCAVQALSPTGEPLWQTPPLDEVTQVALSPDGRRLALAGRHGPASLWQVDGDDLTRLAIDLGDDDHRWLAIAHDHDSTRTRLAAALEQPGSDTITGFIVWEIAWDTDDGATPTPHVLYEDTAVRDVLRDEFGEAVIVLGRDHTHLWHLPSGAIHRLPSCAGELRGFALAPAQDRVALVGTTHNTTAADTACVVDLADRSSHRLPLRGVPWAWDGQRRFASVYQGVEIELWTDPTPDDPAVFLRWLAEHTTRDLPLSALAGEGKRP